MCVVEMTERIRTSAAVSLAGLLTACGSMNSSPMETTEGTSGGEAGSTSESSTPATDSDATEGTTDATSGDATGTAGSSEESSSDAESSGVGPTGDCQPPALLELAGIPDDPSLAYDEGSDVVATFEVDGHDLIGKHVTDVSAAEGGLALWQEITLRIPANQLADLVQLDIYLDTDPVAYFNRNGNVTTERQGVKLGFSVENFELNDPDPCAPLRPARGNFDWSLVHEFGHLRGFVDRSWFRFLAQFPDVRGSGEGYPEDGSPVLTRDFVTSYAERADGDEDYAESWTTYVMLSDSDLPAPTEDEPLALQKVRWMDMQPGLRELREAIRVTEPDAVEGDVGPAPPLDPSWLEPGNSPILAPVLYQGRWQQSATDGVVLTLTADDVVISQYEGGAETSRVSMAEQRAADGLDYYQMHNTSPSFAYSYVLADEPALRHNHDFFFFDTDGNPVEDGSVLFAREVFDSDSGELEFLPPLTLTKVE